VDTCVYVCVSWLWCLFMRGCGVCLCSMWCGVCCDAVWTMLLAAAACVDARVLCGLTAATDWRLGGGWPAWWRGHWMYSWYVVCLCGMSLVSVEDVVGGV
jgi:hypothetical protein